MTRPPTQTRSKGKPATGGAAESLYVELARTHEAVHAVVNEVFATFELTTPQYNVLRILRGAGPEGLPTLDIRQHMIHRLPDITRLIDRLEDRGLVARDRSDTDRRVVRIVITRKGRALLTRIDEPLEAAHREHSRSLTKTETQTILNLLAKWRSSNEGD